ncbi:DUF6299 family protein, partial [Streptomyces sp. NPDC127574]
VPGPAHVEATLTDLAGTGLPLPTFHANGEQDVTVVRG